MVLEFSEAWQNWACIPKIFITPEGSQMPSLSPLPLFSLFWKNETWKYIVRWLFWSWHYDQEIDTLHKWPSWLVDERDAVGDHPPLTKRRDMHFNVMGAHENSRYLGLS